MFQALLKHYRGEEFQSDVIAKKEILPLVLGIPLMLNCHRPELYRAAGEGCKSKEGKEKAPEEGRLWGEYVSPREWGLLYFALRFSAWSAKPLSPE